MKSQTLHHIAYGLFAILFAATIKMTFAQPAGATTVPVTSTLDSGPGSLRQAALAATPDDTIVFDSWMFSVPVTITLTSGQIEITKSLSIDGAHGGVITPTISGNSTSRVFQIGPGAVVTLTGLQVVNGRCVTCNGGGAYVAAFGSLSVLSSTFSWNVADDAFSAKAGASALVSSGEGGAIHNEGMLNVVNTLFIWNSAVRGGALANDGVASIVDVLLDDNSAWNDGHQGDGGGIYNRGTLIAVGVTLTDNLASQYGGGILNVGVLTLTGSMLTSNRTDDFGTGGVVGGGIANTGILSVVSSTFAGNLAGTGGAIANGISGDGELSVVRSVFTHNVASSKGSGRGAAIANGSSSSIADSTFFGNQAYPSFYGPGVGGAIYSTGALSIVNSTFTGNLAGLTVPAPPSYKGFGGAIYNDGLAVITNSTLYSNWATSSGSGAFSDGSTIFWNTIIAGGGASGNCAGGVTLGGYNLDDGNTCGFTSAHSLTNTNPLLGLLGNYGGAIPTIALLYGSPAIDAGDDAVCPATDARGTYRPQGPHCDIGAYEHKAFSMFWFMPVVRR